MRPLVEPMRAADLLEAIERIRSRATPDVDELRQTLARFAASVASPDPGLWPDSEGRYTRVLLNSPDDAYQALLVMWPPGARSAIHDHADVTGAVVPLRGEVTETKYAVDELPDGRVRLRPCGRHRLRVGEASPITPEDGTQLHDVINETSTWAVTLHVYLRGIDRFNVYRADASGLHHREHRVLWFDYADGAATWDRAVARAEDEPTPDGGETKGHAGSCACGALRLEVDAAPVVQLCCHCSDCRRATGSTMAPLAFFPAASLRWTRGTPKHYEHHNDSGHRVSKYFCADCGTTMAHQSGSAPHLLAVLAGVLDDPERFRPTTNIYLGSAPRWAQHAVPGGGLGAATRLGPRRPTSEAVGRDVARGD